MNNNRYQFTPFTEVLCAFRAGKMVLMVDDDNRENEGDLVVATEKVTAKDVAFMASVARGLICVSIDDKIAKKLNIPLQVIYNNAPLRTAFTVSINHRTTKDHAITAEARALTMQRLVAEDAVAEEFLSPGYVFPLIANPQGVIARRGQTEGSYDLARLAGLAPSGVICEVMADDGTMLRGEGLISFAKEHNLPFTSVEEVLRYRIQHEPLIRETARAEQSTTHGVFKVVVFEDDVFQKEHLALIYGDINNSKRTPLVRIHSECLTGDVFGSRRCDCGGQLDSAMQHIVNSGAGIILYLRQEGRGIGLSNKLRAYAVQDSKGLDTVDANLHLGFEPDSRDFSSAAAILKLLKIQNIRLLTNNPKKVETLESCGIIVAERVPLIVDVDQYSKSYLDTKREKLGHIL